MLLGRVLHTWTRWSWRRWRTRPWHLKVSVVFWKHGGGRFTNSWSWNSGTVGGIAWSCRYWEVVEAWWEGLCWPWSTEAAHYLCQQCFGWSCSCFDPYEGRAARSAGTSRQVSFWHSHNIIIFIGVQSAVIVKNWKLCAELWYWSGDSWYAIFNDIHPDVRCTFLVKI